MSTRRVAVGLIGTTVLSLPIMLWAVSASPQEQLPWARGDQRYGDDQERYGDDPRAGTAARSNDAYSPRYGAPRGPANDAYSPGYGGATPNAGDAHRRPRQGQNYDSATRGGDAYSPPRADNYAQQPGTYGQPPSWTTPGQGYGQPYTQPGQGYNQPSSGYGQPYPPPPQAYNGPPNRYYGPDGYNRRYEPGPYSDEAPDGSYSSREILDAGHGFFGSVSRGLASIIEYAFQQQGRPNGYILGQDAGGAFVAGLRYGEGILYTKDAGTHRVYWQGPSIGYDAGIEGSKVMMLVYNLRDPYEIYQRFGGVDGSAYVVGGVGMTFQKSGDIVVAPIRAGVGLRLGANVGYLKYTRRPTWNPF